MSASRSGNNWDEIRSVIGALPTTTGVNLKALILAINTRTGAHISRTGKKQELVDRVIDYLDNINEKSDWKTWDVIKPLVYAMNLPLPSRNKVHASPTKYYPSSTYNPPPAAPYAYRAGGSGYSLSAPGSSTPYSAVRSLPPANNFRFRLSPFFTVNEVVSRMLECPESYSNTDRRDVSLTFSLDAAQLAKLSGPNTQHKLRLFCTSSKFYDPHRPRNLDLPIEFPGTCEVFINNVQIKASLLKGMKKMPGTAPPPDLGVASLRPAGNEVKMVYINHTPQGSTVEYKKFYLVAQLVQVHSVANLVQALVATKFVSPGEVRQTMAASMTADEDIIAGTLKLSLKCPLSFARIAVPSRSRKCTHAQCFDAHSWYAVMEQTTTWLCPVCENALNWHDLIVDGLLAEILTQTPPSTDDVLLEADGSWRTLDGRWSSSRPFDPHAPGAEVVELDDSDEDF
ncbi:hypothetical protein MKEN_00968300 [Mycena kentingensis (nom. inval.)]|nr:hypothetical protein MKEN_00968300 [Mycena kentingensis (nom. inval.)]